MKIFRTVGGLSGAAGVLALTLIFPGEAAANCKNGNNVQTVLASDVGANHLNQVMYDSTPPCTITVNAGTINGATTTGVGGDLIFRIRTGITVKAATPGTTTLAVPAGSSFGVIIQALNGACPSNAVLDGFVISGGFGGILVKALQPGVCASDQVTGVTLRNNTINTVSGSGSGTHGIEIANVQNSVIDSNTIVTARANGIYLEPVGGVGSNNNIVMNNTVQQTITQHAIAVQSSSDNVIVGNTVTGSAFDGIILNSTGSTLTTPGSSRNRVERNTISGHNTDGILMTDGSRFNYVGLNKTASSSYDPISKPVASPTTGVGIWVNNDSNGIYLFGNELSGSPENGIDILTSKSLYVQANKIHNNQQGGIWSANYQFVADNSAATNQDIVVHANHAYFNSQNAQLNLQGNARVDVAYNFFSGEQTGNGLSATLASTNTGGIMLQRGGSTGSPARADIPVSEANIYENTITDVNNRVFAIDTSTSNTTFFRNRFLDGTNVGTPPPGRQGLAYAYTGVGITWDASRTLGGNHWSDFATASGNPDPFHPFKKFVYDNVHGVDGNAPFADKFPYSSEGLTASPFGAYAVSVLEPVAGQVLAAGSKKTIRWVARGCVLVNLNIAGGGSTVIDTNVPNTGFYTWTVPANPVGAAYSITVDCRTSTGGTTGVNATSGLFKIATSSLTLMSPGRSFRATNGGVVRVAWKKSGVTNVNVFVKVVGGGETQIGTNLQGTWGDVTLPAGLNNSGLATLRIVDAGNANNEDSVDGTFMVRGTGTFNTTFAGQNLLIGSIQNLVWSGPPTSYTLDLDLYEGGVLAKSIVKNLPDFGNFTWFVPEMWSLSSTIRATFKDANGGTVGTANTGTFKVSYQTASGVAVNRYRLYSPVTLEHHFTTDQNEYNFLGTLVGTWSQEGTASKMHNGPANIAGTDAVPYYRLYDQIVKWHHWTTDRNEYFVLRANTGRYVAEGVDGYIFKTQVTGTVPWYRLVYPGIAGLHTWTADLNERNSLVGSGSWVEEQKEYVIP